MKVDAKSMKFETDPIAALGKAQFGGDGGTQDNDGKGTETRVCSDVVPKHNQPDFQLLEI